MAGFRLTDGSSGCPPTETPPADYEIPFRFDAAGKLWITSCFKNLQYFGAARHDITTGGGVIGNAGLLQSTDPDIVNGDGVTAGTYTNLTVTNTTGCDIGLLLGHDVFVDMTTNSGNLVRWVLSARVNGAHYSISAASSVNHDGASMNVRSQFTASANPHNNGIEGGGANDLILASGASVVIGAKMFVAYVVGSPNGAEVVNSAASAVRVYGYVV
jgi:hypothetical protein